MSSLRINRIYGENGAGNVFVLNRRRKAGILLGLNSFHLKSHKFYSKLGLVLWDAHESHIFHLKVALAKKVNDHINRDSNK